MFRHTIILSLALFSGLPRAIAQWTQQASNTTNNLWSICFLNKDTGYVVGNGGTILKTVNGGSNWTPQTSGTSVNLFSVFFLNKDTGFVAGNGGTILKTIDGGANWVAKSSGFITPLNCISFGNYNSGVASGQNGVLLYSSDGGETWVQKAFPWQYNDATSVGRSVMHVASKIVYLVGYHYRVNVGFEFLIIKSSDGGNSWYHNTISPVNCFPIPDVYFTDTLNGWLSAQSYALHTTDGGVNWTGSIVGPNWLAGIAFTNQSTGYTCGDSILYSTNDTGKTWGTHNFGNGVFLSDAEFPTKNIGYLVGNSGRIYKTTNGGAVGLSEVSRVSAALRIFPDPSEGILNIEHTEDMYEVRAFNTLGELVRSISLVNQRSLSIDMSASPKGIYLIEVIDKTGSITRGKLILE